MCTDSGDYFQKRTMSQSHGFLLSKLVVLAGFGPKLAQIWANLVHLKAWKGWHYVSGALEVPMTLKNMLRLRSRVSKVKNSRDIFTLFSPHSKCPFFKLVRETCWFIGLRASFYPYASNHRPYSVGIFFYMMWRMMNRAQLAVYTRWTTFKQNG